MALAMALPHECPILSCTTRKKDNARLQPCLGIKSLVGRKISGSERFMEWEIMQEVGILEK